MHFVNSFTVYSTLSDQQQTTVGYTLQMALRSAVFFDDIFEIFLNDLHRQLLSITCPSPSHIGG
jgi:hypothetical protein